jgi:hypothetical protein
MIDEVIPAYQVLGPVLEEQLHHQFDVGATSQIQPLSRCIIE